MTHAPQELDRKLQALHAGESSGSIHITTHDGLAAVLDMFIPPGKTHDERLERVLKTLDEEIAYGEAQITVANGIRTEVVRTIHTVTAYIKVTMKKYHYTLQEVKRILPDGTVKYRTYESSLSEKICFVHGEKALSAFTRAIGEELGITPTAEELEGVDVYAILQQPPRVSERLGGITVDNTLYRTLWQMPFRPHLFRRYYIEYTSDGREIHFRWKRTAKVMNE